MATIIAFCLLFLLLQSPPISSQYDANFPVGHSLTATTNATSLLSPSAHFAFGFHHFPGSTSLFMLSIWYANIPDTIVWSANQGNPVPQGSILTITANDGLLLSDPQGNLLWTTSNALSSGGAVTYGFMYDTGNFALLSSTNSDALVWQTFDHPTDTLLPTQFLEAGGQVDSRISEANYTKGRFQLRFLHDGNLVLNTRDLTTGYAYGAYYVSGTKDADNPQNIGKELVYRQSGGMYILKKNGSRFDLIPSSKLKSIKDYYQRVTLDYNGVLTWYYYPRASTAEKGIGWSEMQSFPDNICMRIATFGGDSDSGACGYNNICSISEDQKPICNCPPSYSLIDPNDINGSCEPDFKPDVCEKGSVKGDYKLIQLENTDWPFADYARLDPTTEEECKTSCLNDCFCSAAIFDGSGSCWKKKLPLSNGRQDSEVARTAWLKVGDANSTIRGPN